MTAPYYGKRKPGSLTAAAPGDTIYFNFGSYNDSGDSEAMTGFAVADIEVFKNGIATTRATDSGYSLISDTGQVGDRVGLHRFSVQLFNTTDDTGHYDAGGWYQVAVDSVSVDGKTVRFWAGSFEIDNVPADTGAVSRAVWNSLLSAHTTDSTYGIIFTDIDTGIRDRLDELDTGMRSWVASDTGLRAILALADTGKIATAVWAGDTGLRDHIDNSDTGVKDAIADLDTGLRDYIDNTDTGLRARLNTLAEDTGGVNITSIFGDTGAAVELKNLMAEGFHDTGLNDRLARILSDVDTGLRAQIGDVDTGLHSFVTSDTGLRPFLNAIDTGLHDTIADLDTGLRGAISFVDTGLHDTLSDFDTGLRDLVSDLKAELDTGLRAKLKTDTGGWLKVDIHKVNDYAVTGAGDTGAGNTWRPV